MTREGVWFSVHVKYYVSGGSSKGSVMIDNPARSANTTKKPEDETKARSHPAAN